MSSRIWLIIRWLVGIGILSAIAVNIEFGRLSRIWRPSVLLYLGGAATILVAAQLLSAFRWKILLLEDEVSWYYLVRLYLIGNFFSSFLPTSIGGDAVRTGALAREGVPLRRSVASVLFDRLLGLTGMIPLFLLGAVLVAADPAALLDRFSLSVSTGQLLAIVAVTAGVVGATAFVFRRRLLEEVSRFRNDFRDLAGSGRKLIAVLALGVAVQAMYVLAWGALVPPTGLDLNWAMLLVAVPVVSVAAMLPLSIAGLGVREGVWIVLLGGGFSVADVVAFSLLYFVAFSLAGAVGGGLYMLKGISSGTRNVSPGEVTAPETLVR